LFVQVSYRYQFLARLLLMAVIGAEHQLFRIFPFEVQFARRERSLDKKDNCRTLCRGRQSARGILHLAESGSAPFSVGCHQSVGWSIIHRPATTPKVYYLEGANIMANCNPFFEAFLEGFTGGGLFTRLRQPGAPTQVFADEDDVEEATSPDAAIPA
jgi:hypothetical protein